MNYFDRVPMAYRPLIEAARALIPAEVRLKTWPRYLIGVSPSYVGLHYFDMAEAFPGLAARGNSYENCAHACYSFHAADGMPTIVVPNPDLYRDPVGTILHEHGHLLDAATCFSITAPETTRYSRTSRAEAFAEAFQIALKPPTGEWESFACSEQMRPLKTAMGVTA